MTLTRVAAIEKCDTVVRTSLMINLCRYTELHQVSRDYNYDGSHYIFVNTSSVGCNEIYQLHCDHEWGCTVQNLFAVAHREPPRRAPGDIHDTHTLSVYRLGRVCHHSCIQNNLIPPRTTGWRISFVVVWHRAGFDFNHTFLQY